MALSLLPLIFSVQNFWFFSFQPWYPSDFYPKKSHLFQPFFDPGDPAGGSQTLKGCSKSKLAIAFLNWRDFGWAKKGMIWRNQKQIQRIQETQQTSNVMFTSFFHDFPRFSTIFVHFLKDRKKKRNQNQTYRNRVAACGVQSNTPQTGNSLVSHPFSWRRSQPTTEKPRRNHWFPHPLLVPQYPTTPPFCPRPVISVGIVQGFLRLNFVFQVKVLVSGVCWGERGHKFSSQLKAVNCDFRSFSFSIEIPASFRGWNL